MTGQIVGDTEWNGLPMPRRLWAILAVTFGVALSVLDGTIGFVPLPPACDIAAGNLRISR